MLVTCNFCKISFITLGDLSTEDNSGNQELLTTDLKFWNSLTCSLWFRPDATIDISFLLVTTGHAAFSFPVALCRTGTGKHSLLLNLCPGPQLLSVFWATTAPPVASAVRGVKGLTEEEEFSVPWVTFPKRSDETDALFFLVPDFCSSAFSEEKAKLLLQKTASLPWSHARRLLLSLLGLNSAVTPPLYVFITSSLPLSLPFPDL